MQQRSGLGLLGMALLLGIAGDALLRATPWGINLVLWLVIAVAGSWAVLPSPPDRRSASGWPVVAALFFAGCLAWRDAPFLGFWNVVAVVGLVCLPVVELRGDRLRSATLTSYLGAGGMTGLGLARGAFTSVPAPMAWGRLARFRSTVGAGLIGLALTVPIVAVFGTLLASADAGFANLVSAPLRVDVADITTHVVLVAVLSWVCSGFIHTLLRPNNAVIDAVVERTGHNPSRLGIVEIGVPLGTLVTLFLAYLLVQANYLFGGEGAMLRAGLTHAEYARQGFVELVVVSAILLPLLMGADMLFRPAVAGHRRWFVRLAVNLVVLAGALMVSAVHRLSLYVAEYGWSEVRLYAMTFMIWVGILHVAYVRTTLRGGRGFPFGAIASAVAVLGMLNLVNPEAVIVRSQLARYERSGHLDTPYLVSLSADAVPELVAAANGLPFSARCRIQRAVEDRRYRDFRADWRTWNVARARARKATAAPPEPLGCSAVDSQ